MNKHLKFATLVGFLGSIAFTLLSLFGCVALASPLIVAFFVGRRTLELSSGLEIKIIKMHIMHAVWLAMSITFLPLLLYTIISLFNLMVNPEIPTGGMYGRGMYSLAIIIMVVLDIIMFFMTVISGIFARKFVKEKPAIPLDPKVTT